MSAAPAPMMRAQPGGQAAPSILTVTKAPRALHIDHRILDQPGLSLTACAILAEVLDLYQVKGKVFADDDHFAARAKCSERTVRSEMAKLEEAGYLTRDVDQRRSGHKRLLVPSEKWQNLPEAPAESAGDTPEPMAEFAGTSGENCQNLRQNLPEPPANSANINTILNTNSNTIQTNHTAAAAASAGFEKKIGAADFQNSETLPADGGNSTPLVAPPPPPKTRRRAGQRPALVQAPPLPEACPLADLLNPPGDAHRVQQLPEPLTEAQAERLLADFPEAAVRDILCQMANWQPLLTKATSANLTARTWLARRTTSPQPLATASSQISQRQANSAALRARYQNPS